MEILRTLQNLTVSSFAGQSRTPFVLETSSCVKEALKTFNTEKVLSCPLGAAKYGADVGRGFLDLFDLLSYLLDLWEKINKLSRMVFQN